MTIKYENLVRDALYNLHPRSGATPEYSKGVIVGVVAMVMAYETLNWEAAVSIIKPFMPAGADLSRLPETWKAEFEKKEKRYGF